MAVAPSKRRRRAPGPTSSSVRGVSSPKAPSRCGSKACEPTSLHDGVLEVLAPSEYVKDRLAKNYVDLILEAATEAVGLPVEIQFDARRRPKPLRRNPKARRSHPRTDVRYARPGRLGAPGLPFPNYTFDAFVPGPSNRFAHAAAMAVAEAPPSKAYNPLFIYGGVGLGKTHLLVADRPPHASPLAAPSREVRHERELRD